ncbi:MAG: sulfatase-like hydrolase/transferase [Gammaproteobacteria bacterium]|nr:sulfatase-like hydrolase/transferase [Gammaproteobacteria bacterium]MBU1978569.1 sulfatase-like hydrolase/transferase [Gammaproteobacteria bacterium]
MKRLAILVCTHNRWNLLEKLLQSLNSAIRPADWEVGILVAANACTDETHQLLDSYLEQPAENKWLPLKWFAEPEAGKSFALNSAIPRITSDLIALVDDDHRVPKDFLVNICRVADAQPDASLFCGRILPDWDGTEPGWIRDDGDYKIYPPPIPYFKLGDVAHFVSGDEITPGGGNLFVRREVFGRVGEFSTDLGPRGHDLGGGEDTAYVFKALAQGVRLYYSPDIVQYHYVGPERLKLGFLMRFAYQRTFAATRLGPGTGKMPAYMWRKLATYGAHALLSWGADRRRFYLIRTAAALGEIKGLFEANAAARLTQPEGGRGFPINVGVVVSVVLGGLAAWWARPLATEGLPVAAGVAALCVAVLLLKSVLNFSRTGPQLKSEILRYYLPYSLYALSRLGFWAFVLCLLMALAGVAYYSFLAAAFDVPIHRGIAAVFGLLGVAIATGLQFCRHLLYIPGSIEASSNYRMSRFYPLWARLTPSRIEGAYYVLLLVFASSAIAGGVRSGLEGRMEYALGLLAAAAAFLIPAVLWRTGKEPRPVRAGTRADGPNILMIGADSLRSDRLGVNGNPRGLTPTLDALANRGVLFQQCFVPCARTAPSLASMLSGRWPHGHGIRDNFSTVDEAELGRAPLPHVLQAHGYRTIAISDWCGSDLGKFPFGFGEVDLPQDQWNIRYLIRQGPKDIRLFLSLFTHNDFGRRFLPELYYLAGVPMTSELGRRTRGAISRCAREGHSFFMNVFMSATHAPFGSEYPYYTRYASKEYSGCSKFVMSGLNEPFEVIQRQKQGKEFFDLEQVLNLYDGCVSNFDNEVARTLAHLDQCGLTDNTIVVIYSDHGMEFFERETWGQGNSVIVDDSSRIPLIIADPRRPNGQTISHTVRSIDLAPTLLALVGLPIPKEMQGVSLKQCIDGEIDDPGLAAYAETGIWVTRVPSMEEDHITYPDLPDLLEITDKRDGTMAIKADYRDLIVTAKDRMVRTDRWKVVHLPMRDGVSRRLFDLENDPTCLNDVSAIYPEVMAEMSALLQQWLAEDARMQRGGPDVPS